MFWATKKQISIRLKYVQFKIRRTESQIQFRGKLDFKERIQLKEALKELKVVENLLRNSSLFAKD